MRFFDRYDRFYATSGTARFPNRFNQRYRAIIEPHRHLFRGSRVLDIASHDGRWSFAALKAGACHVAGVEARRELVERAQVTFRHYGINEHQWRFECADATEYLRRLEANSFDVVLCLGFFYHTMNHMELFAQMARTGAQSIVIDTVVSTVAASSIDVFVEDSWEARNAVDSIHSGQRMIPVGIPSRAAIRDMAQYAGFGVTELDWTQIATDWSECDDYRAGRRSTFLCRRTTVH